MTTEDLYLLIIDCARSNRLTVVDIAEKCPDFDKARNLIWRLVDAGVLDINDDWQVGINTPVFPWEEVKEWL